MPVMQATGGQVRRRPSLTGSASTNVSLLGVTVAVAVGFGIARPGFLGADNLLDIGQQSAVIAIVAFAMTAVIIARGIDISVGGVLAASGMLAGTAYEAGWPPVVCMLVAICGGAALGALNGVLIGFVGISPFMATLAILAFSRGLNAVDLRRRLDPDREPDDDVARLRRDRAVPRLAARRHGRARRLDLGLRPHRLRTLAVRGRRERGGRAGVADPGAGGAMVDVRDRRRVGRAGRGADDRARELGAAARRQRPGVHGDHGRDRRRHEAVGRRGSAVGTAIGSLLLGVVATGLSFMEV